MSFSYHLGLPEGFQLYTLHHDGDRLFNPKNSFMRTNSLLLVLVAGTILATGCKKTEIAPAPPAAGEAATASNRNAHAALLHTRQYSAEVATAWYDLLTGITRVTPYFPAPTTRLFAYTGMALYESVVPGMPSYQSMYTYRTGKVIAYDKKKDYYWPAAANAAIARVSARLLANNGTPPKLAWIQQLEATMNHRFATLITAEQLQQSTDFGHLVADAIYDWSTTDGTLNPDGTPAACPRYSPLGTPGSWVPTPPGFLPASGACQGSLRTFLPGIVVTARPPAPLPYSTDPASAFYQAAKEVYDLRNNLSRSDSLIAENWRDLYGYGYNTPAHLLKLTTTIIDKEGMNLEDASVLYAREGMAMFDAIATSIGAKFYYSVLRPITYIRTVMGHPTWTTLFPTPQHPSYPAVAPGATGASVAVLEAVLGTSYAFIDSTQAALYGTWSHSSLDHLLQDVEKSRTHSGLNFRFSAEQGAATGRQIGTLVNALPFKKQ